MKVIFLDIDGVLNSSGFAEKNRAKIIDNENLNYLRELTESTGAVLVLSSGWKLAFDDDLKPKTPEAVYLNYMLNESGISLYDKTPDYSTELIRKSRIFSDVKAKEIKAWLDAHNDIDSFIVLDDMDLKDSEINSRRICVNSKTGLAKADVGDAINMLINEGPSKSADKH